MPSYEYRIDDRARAASRYLARVREELLRALVTEKETRHITQQSIAELLGKNRSVVNRQFMGLDDLTTRTVAELLWALGWEPFFEARKPAVRDGQNEIVSQPKVEIGTSGSGSTPPSQRMTVTVA